MTAVAEPRSARTVVRRACPDDCPDTCATLVRSPRGRWLGNSPSGTTVIAVSRQDFTDLGNAPTFSDTHVEIAAV
jgi:hypothetical protein